MVVGSNPTRGAVDADTNCRFPCGVGFSFGDELESNPTGDTEEGEKSFRNKITTLETSIFFFYHHPTDIPVTDS
ncbi:MAG: hypothetical protein HY226_00310 [Candidatus Vogelbacteria bacterium]|nr:hypothetical protein [Candidatus Vogelbacteria bacterium]